MFRTTSLLLLVCVLAAAPAAKAHTYFLRSCQNGLGPVNKDLSAWTGDSDLLTEEGASLSTVRLAARDGPILSASTKAWPLYKTYREWDVQPGQTITAYTLPVVGPAGDYSIALHFAEVGTATDLPRKFDVFVNGVEVKDVNVYEKIGVDTALVKFLDKFRVKAEDKTITIKFRADAGKPMLSGFQVMGPEMPLEVKLELWSTKLPNKKIRDFKMCDKCDGNILEDYISYQDMTIVVNVEGFEDQPGTISWTIDGQPRSQTTDSYPLGLWGSNFNGLQRWEWNPPLQIAGEHTIEVSVFWPHASGYAGVNATGAPAATTDPDPEKTANDNPIKSGKVKFTIVDPHARA